MENTLKPHAYCLVYFGKVPDHVNHCISQIKSADPKREIYFITDDCQFDYPGVTFIRDYPLENIGNYFSSRRISLWTTSLQRVFALEWLAKKFSTKLIHFDCDVLIYYPFEEIERFTHGRNFMTPLNRGELNFSYFVMSDLESFSSVVSDIRVAVRKGEAYCQSVIGGMPNEMALMNYYSMGRIQTLPTNPLMSTINGMLFDAADYGIYIDGMDQRYHEGKGKGFIHRGFYTGDFLADLPNTDFRIGFEERKPILIWKDQKYHIFNLHIHDKNLIAYTLEKQPTDTFRDILKNKIKTITKPNQKWPYRLGDAILLELTRAIEGVTHPQWRGTLGHTYFYHRGKSQNYALLRKLIEEKKKTGFETPMDDELVVHFRIGDWKRVEPTEVNGINQLTEAMCSKHGLKKLRLVCALHNHALTEKENPWGALPAYVKYCTEELKLEVDVKSSNTADEDFVFLTSAKYLICSKGNFSRLAYYTSETQHKELMSDEK
jgi:hypothetical protein